MKYLYLIISVLLLTACSSQEVGVSDIVGYDMDLLQNGDGLEIKEINIVKFEDNAELVIKKPKKIAVSDSRIFVLDDNKVASYDRAGRYVNTIGQMGHGHGEYLQIASFYLEDENTVALVDSYKDVILKYGLDGSFKEEMKGDELFKYVQSASLIGRDSLLVCNYLFNDQNKVFNVVKLDDMRMKGVADTNMGTAGTMEPVGVHPYSSYNGHVKYILPFDNKIYDVRKGATFQFLTNKNIYSRKELGEVKDFSIMSYLKTMQNGNFLGFSDIFETDNYIFAACRNIDYVFWKKGKENCAHYSYALKENLNVFPLINIVASYGNSLYGLMNTSELAKIKGYNRRDKNICKLMEYKDEKDACLLISYKMK